MSLILPPSTGDDQYSKWDKVRVLLQSKQKLLTTRVLISALKQKPPGHVIQFMLSVNPNVANIPSSGPTPLQVAVEYDASLDVIEMLLRAYPFALCVTNPGHEEDPLSYAKRNRKDNQELIQLLEKPLGFWIEATTKQRNVDNRSITSFQKHHSERPISPKTVVVETETVHNQSLVDQQELANVKLLCAQALRAHKKLSQQLTIYQDQLEAAKYDKVELLKELEAQQKKHFRYQLIALDMKEKALRSHCKTSQENCIKECKSNVEVCQEEFKTWKVSADKKMSEWEDLVEQEAKINAHFRNDLSKWIEEQNKRPPFLFATYIGEEKDEESVAPLLSNDVKKRQSWRPFCIMRNLDCISLQDEEKEE